MDLQVLEAYERAEKRKKPSPVVMFDDVYKELPTRLQQQREDMKKHVSRYPDQYPLDSFDPISAQ